MVNGGSGEVRDAPKRGFARHRPLPAFCYQSQTTTLHMHVIYYAKVFHSYYSVVSVTFELSKGEFSS